MPRVFLPVALRSLIDGQEAVDAEGSSVRELIDQLEQRYPGLRVRLCQGNRLAPGISVVVSGAVSSLGLRQPVAPDAEVHFLPAIGGG
jgi:molybdopterin synthase sulfur carrier subunit